MCLGSFKWLIIISNAAVNSSMENSFLRCPICSIQSHSPHCSVLLSALMASHFLFVFSNAPKVERAGVISSKRAWYICQTFMHYCPSTFMHYCPSEDNWIASIFLLIAFFIGPRTQPWYHVTCSCPISLVFSGLTHEGKGIQFHLDRKYKHKYVIWYSIRFVSDLPLFIKLFILAIVIKPGL